MDKTVLGLLMLALILPLFVSADNIFTRNLYFGLHGDQEVARLQDFLRPLGFYISPLSNGNYLWTTTSAVKKFQQAHHIYPATGYFGPQTRVVVNKLIETNALLGQTKNLSAPATVGSSQLSAYKNKLAVYAYDSDKPEYENIYIQNQGDTESIDITGFRLENITGTSFTIPKAQALPAYYSTQVADDRVILRPYGRAIITVGRQAKNIDFQANLCTGYFSENSKFIPSLSQNCPRIDTGKLPLEISDRCINIINSTPSCRQPDYTQVFEDSCSDYLNKHISYAGCVADNRDRKDFYSGDWYIWMQRREEFLRSGREAVVLKNREGKEVARYSY